MRKALFPLVLIALVISSCSLQKRHFRSGYYVSFKHAKKHSHNVVSSSAEEAEMVSPTISSFKSDPVPSKKLTASLKTVGIEPVAIRKTILDNCDTILFRKGDLIAAKVTEVTPTEIKYRRCGTEGPLYVVNRNDVRSVKYSNGEVEEFRVEMNHAANKTAVEKIEELQIKKDSENSLVLGLAALPAMFLGGIGLLVAWYAIRTGRRAKRAIAGSKDPRIRQLYYQKANIGYSVGLAIYCLCIALALLLALILSGSGFGLGFVFLLAAGVLLAGLLLAFV